MKIQLDTELKIVRIEESVNLGAFIALLEDLLPDGKWREYKLEKLIVENWTNPIIIRTSNPYLPSIPPYPTIPWITCTTDTNTIYDSTTPTVYNIECILQNK